MVYKFFSEDFEFLWGKYQVLLIFHIQELSAMQKYGHLMLVELNYSWHQTFIPPLLKTPYLHDPLPLALELEREFEIQIFANSFLKL